MVVVKAERSAWEMEKTMEPLTEHCLDVYSVEKMVHLMEH
jgi:hypothetical protein